MPIGDLYSAANVVTGQAAIFVSPANTALIDLSKFNTADPFDATPWVAYTINPGTATTFTVTFARRGATATSATQTLTGLTAAALQSALEGMSTIGVGNVKVSGTTGGPFSIVLNEGLTDGVLTTTPTGGTLPFVGPLWVPVGATEQGWQLGADKSTQPVNIEEQSTPVGTTITSQTVTIQGNLSEDISKTLTLALNAVATKVAPTSTTPGYDDIRPTDTVLQYAVGMVTSNAEGLGRIIYAPAWTSLAGVSASFRRAAGQRLYGVTFSTVCDTSKIRILNFTAPKAP